MRNQDLDNSQTTSKIKLKNIGKEKLYLKFIFKNITSTDYDVEQQFWANCRFRDGEVATIFIDNSYFNGFLDGCEFDLYVDLTTIEDVVIHNHLNETYTSLNTYFETLNNSEVFNDNETICLRTNNDVLEVGF